MCHYVTAALPPGTDLPALRQLLGGKCGLVPVENPSVQAQLPPGTVYVYLSGNYCDCGTPLGRLRRDLGRADDPEGQVPRLRRKGWSEARISRWRDQKQAAREKDRRTVQGMAEGMTAEVEWWLSYLRRLLGAGGVRSIGLLLHWYSGSLTGERITLRERIRLPIGQVRPEFLVQIEEDVLYELWSAAGP